MHAKHLYDNLLGNAIKGHYRIEEIASIGHFKQGYRSDSCVVGARSERYFLKKYHGKFDYKINFIFRAIDFFYNYGIPTILPIKTREGKSYFIYNNQCYALFPYIAELRIASKILSKKTLNSAGIMLARIHLVGKNNYPKDSRRITKNWSKDDFNIKIEKILDILNKKLTKDKIDKLFIKEMALKTKFVAKNNINLNNLGLTSNHLVHGDYHKKNFSVDKQGDVNYVFDFKSKISPRALELGRAIDLICFDDYQDKNYSNATVFLNGYQSVYPIKKTELLNGILAYYIKNFYDLWAEREYYFNGNKLVGRLIKRNFKKLKYRSKNLNLIINNLTNRA